MSEIKIDEVITAEEGQIRELLPVVAAGLDDLRDRVCAVARVGADLGMHVEGWKKHKRVRSDEEFWNTLRGIDEQMREDVIRFALRAVSARRKCLALDDPSQLTFALAVPGEEAAGEPQVPVRREDNEVLVLTSAVQKLRGFFNEWKERTPVRQWSPELKQAVRDTLRPLLAIAQEVGE